MNLMERMFGTRGTGGARTRAAARPADAGEARRSDIEKWWTYYHGVNPATGKS